jgi:hypothetical protein
VNLRMMTASCPSNPSLRECAAMNRSILTSSLIMPARCALMRLWLGNRETSKTKKDFKMFNHSLK